MVVVSAALTSCGGGGSSSGVSSGGSNNGSSSPPASISYSITNIKFQAAKPYSQTPASQTITGTVTGTISGTLYIVVTESNPQVATVSNFVVTSNTTGQATVIPASPGTLLAGSYNETLTVRACDNDPTCATGQLGGSPQTITVNYDIGSSVDTNTVTPRVVESNVAGMITLRGQGFAAGDTVTIGSTVIPSSSINYYSGSDMVVPYPPLAAGTYPISINSGSVSYSATLTVVDPTAYPAGFLSYPGIVPTAIQSLVYDAQRQALFVVLATGTGPVLLRYAYSSSGWSSPTSVSIAGLQQVQLSPDGTKLLALILDAQQLSVAELDPVTLAQSADTPLPGSIATISPGGSQAAWFSLANDGNAIVVINAPFTITAPTTGAPNAFAFAFGTHSRQYSLIALSNSGPLPIEPVSSGNGNIVGLGALYNASGGTVSGVGTPLGGFGSSSDLAGGKFVLPNPPSMLPGVYSSVAGGPMGYLPATQGAVINSDGTRVYDVESAQLDPSPDLHIFDSSAPASATPSDYPELTPPLRLAGDPGVASSVPPLLAISVDSGTVFVAGVNGIAVQPVTPQ